MTINVSKFRKALDYLRAEGLQEFIARVRFGAKKDLAARFKYALLDELLRDPATDSVPGHTINWFISGFSATSGGHINIMRFVQALEAQGYDCRIVIADGDWMGAPSSVREAMIRAFGPMKAQVYLNLVSAPPAYACVATGFDTAYFVRAFTSTRKKFYFVQDFEPWFYAAGSEHTFAEQTYRFGFVGLTAGHWLAQKLTHEYGMQTHPFGFSYDTNLYKKLPRTPQAIKRVFFYARPETERRAFELGVLSLHQLHRHHPQIMVVFAGGNLERQHFAFPHEIHGKLNVRDLGTLYNSCDAALVLSMTNVSLLPLELMACGTPVVSNQGAWVEWLLNSDNAKLTPAEPGALAAALAEILFDPAEWERLHRAGIATAIQTSWEAEARSVAKALAQHSCVPPVHTPSSSLQ